MFWFAVGGVGSAGMNTGLLHVFHRIFGWRDFAALALSFFLMTALCFLWNYFVNFRTSDVWHDCLGRYLGSVSVCYALNVLISLSAIKKLGAEGSLARLAIITTVLSFTGGVKFLLYHFWVFPHGKPRAEEA